MNDTAGPVETQSRAQRYRSKGRNINLVISDPEALARLEKMTERLGSIKMAIETALKECPLPRPLRGRAAEDLAATEAAPRRRSAP